MSAPLRIAVVQGGPSSEAEVSRVSARAVAEALQSGGYQVVRLELDAFVAESLRSGSYDVVFPVVHGAVGEDGCLQGLLEVLGLPYVGAGVLASAQAMDKRVARRAFAAEGLPIPAGVALERGALGGDARAAAERARRLVGARLVVKPASSGSAIGVARLDETATLEDLARAVEQAWALDHVAVAEHFARGKEVTCGVLDVPPDGARALPPTEIVSPRDAFYTFEARYAPGRSVHACPAALPADVLAHVQEVAVLAHGALGCRDLSRVDFIVGDEGKPGAVFLLEVNTMPGFTATSLYPEAAGVAGLTFPELCSRLVRAAHGRGSSRRNAARAFPHV